MVDVPDHTGLKACIPGDIGTERIFAPANILLIGKDRINIQMILGFYGFH
jgi:hypothetical protein